MSFINSLLIRNCYSRSKKKEEATTNRILEAWEMNSMRMIRLYSNSRREEGSIIMNDYSDSTVFIHMFLHYSYHW